MDGASQGVEKMMRTLVRFFPTVNATRRRLSPRPSDKRDLSFIEPLLPVTLQAMASSYNTKRRPALGLRLPPRR
jgi:hypothetical protein